MRDCGLQGLEEKELAGMKGSNPRKVELARVIRQNTAASRDGLRNVWR